MSAFLAEQGYDEPCITKWSMCAGSVAIAVQVSLRLDDVPCRSLNMHLFQMCFICNFQCVDTPRSTKCKTVSKPALSVGTPNLILSIAPIASIGKPQLERPHALMGKGHKQQSTLCAASSYTCSIVSIQTRSTSYPQSYGLHSVDLFSCCHTLLLRRIVQQ